MIIRETYSLTPESFLPKKEHTTISEKTSFSEVFEYTVKKGDTLTKIIEKALVKRNIVLSKKEVSALIKKTAKLNLIKNPDLIYPGQKIVVKLENKECSNLPVSGIITSGFGLRRDPFTHRIKFHSGIDIAAPEGTPIRSVISGEVVFSGWMRGYGNVVIVKNGDIFVKYAHNSKNFVKKGDYIKKGDIVAAVGSTGRSTSPHVHFEVVVKGRAVNPLEFFDYS